MRKDMMRKTTALLTTALVLALVLPMTLQAQQRDLDYFRTPDQRGVTVFEPVKQSQLTDFDGYSAEFLKLFGFGVDGVDYDADVSPIVEADF